MRGSLDIVNKEDRISELEHRMGDPSFWDDPEKAQKIAQDVNALKEEVEGFHKLASDVDDLEALWEMATECPIVFPKGVAVVPWMVPGGKEIAVATSNEMKEYQVEIKGLTPLFFAINSRFG